jgi:MFS family permease
MRFGRYDVAAFWSFFAYASGVVVIPVALVALAGELGFALEEGGLAAGGGLHFGRTSAMVFSMLACGFLAGRLGKRRTMGAALILLAAGLGLCALAPAYGVLFAALLLCGLGEGVVEGLATPFVEGLHKDEPARYINFTHAFWSVGVLATVLVAGMLLARGVSWRWITGGVGLVALMPALLLLLFARSGKAYPEVPAVLHLRVVAAQAGEICRRPRFWLYFAAMFVAGGGELCLTYWTASLIQLQLGESALAGGSGIACFAAGMVLGRTFWGYVLHEHHLRPLIIGSALAGTLITLFIPHAQSLLLLYPLLLLAGLATAPFWPSVQSYSVTRLPGTDSTMVFILLSCAGIPGSGFFTWLTGILANHAAGGLRHAFYLVPACYLVLALLMVTDLFSGRGR